MKTSILLVIGISCSFFSFSQSIIVLDSVTKEAVPFTAIKTGKNTGFYTSVKGVLQKHLIHNVMDTIHLSAIGYKEKKYVLQNSKQNDTLWLVPKIEQLNEVLVSATKYKVTTLGYANKKQRLTWNINQKSKLATLLKPQKQIGRNKIKSIRIPIDKQRMRKTKEGWNKHTEKFSSVFRLHVYSVKAELPDKNVLSKPLLIYCNDDADDILNIDISEEHIEFKQEGIFLILEMIGELDTNQNIVNVENPLPGFKFTNKKTRDFVSKSFYKSVFTDDDWKNIKEDRHFSFLGANNFNLAIGLVLNLYED